MRTHVSVLGFIFFLLAIWCGCATSVHAQTLAPDLSITTIPTDPKPLQQVTLSVQSYSIDLNQTTVTWKYNGQIIASSIGATQINVAAPASGQTGTVTVTVDDPVAGPASATTILRPASVDMLWEAADAYTPPFYKGKALLPINGLIRVTAIPTASAPKNVEYTWSHNGSVLQDQSGYDKSSVTFQNDTLDPTEDVSVDVSGGSFSGSGDITLTPGQPSLIAYLKNEGFIDYANGSTGAITATGNGTIVHFEPYYFSTPNNSATIDLDTEFTLDGSAVTGTPATNELTFSNPKNGAAAEIDVTISTVKYTLQNLERKFTLSFQ